MTATPLPPPRLAASGKRAAGLLLGLFIFFMAAYTLTASSDVFSTGDTTIRIEVAENLLGRLGPDLHGWILQYPHHLKKEYFDPRISIGRQGKTYSTYLLGQPLAIIPFDFLGSRLAVHERWPYGPALYVTDRLVGPLFGALEAVMFFMFAVRLGFGSIRSLLLTLILAFATTVWPDEQSVLEHGEVAFFLLMAMYCAFRYRDQGASWRLLIWAGVGIGGAVITRYQDAFLGALAVGLYLALPGGTEPYLTSRIRRLVLFGAGIVPFALMDMWWSWVRYGKPFESGHHETVFGYAIWKGAAGLAISPGKGLLWYCPTVILLVLAARPFFRRFSALSIAIAALTAGFFLLYGYVTYWHGDPTWGPRYVFATVPFLTLPLGTLLRWPGKQVKVVWAVTALAVLAGFTVQLAAVSVSPWRSWYRVIAYEEQGGHQWQWIAARYRYQWDIHESPLIFQLHGMYQLAYDDFLHRTKYEIAPPDEDPILDNLTWSYPVNQWNVWWASNEFNWWMGRDKVIEISLFLVALMVASGTYVVAESAGIFLATPVRTTAEPIPAEAA